MQNLDSRIFEIERDIFICHHAEALNKLNQFLIDCAKPNFLEAQFPDFKLINIDPTKNPEISGLSIRIANAIQNIFLSNNIVFDLDNTRTIIHFKDWVCAIFRYLPFQNTDHILSAISEDSTYSGERLWRFCALYTTESNIKFDWAEFFQENQQACMTLAFSILSCSQFITKNSTQLRDELLCNLPKLIDQVNDLDCIPTEILHHAYMRCSYSTFSDKHNIKTSIVNLIRRDLNKRGYYDSVEKYEFKQKPKMVIILDWWTSNHAMYRCYGQVVRSLSKRFYLIAMVHNELIDDEAIKLFDEVHHTFSINNPIYNNYANGYKKIKEIMPDILYFPSVGMSPMTLFFASIRNAPIQICTLGHPATTASPCIDYAINSPEFYGEANAYLEPTWLLPYGVYSFSALPHQRNGKLDKLPSAVVNIAITASVYKINPAFLEICKAIEQRSSRVVKFNFYLASIYGLQYVSAKKSIFEIFPEASVFPNQDHPAYMRHLEKNDIFLCPFPFGNTNGIIDAVACGLPGVCLYGSEPHSAIDEGMFKICGLPESLVARTLDEYVNITLKLINSPDDIKKIRKSIHALEIPAKLAENNVELFCDSLYDLYLTKGGFKSTL